MFQQMRYFIAVVEEHNFLRAAERCNISQSAISQQIKALENKIGAQLLARKGRSFELTEAGEYFYNQSKPLLRSLDALVCKTGQMAQNVHSSLKVAYLQSYGSAEFLQAVSKFSQRFPQIVLDIEHGTHEDLYRLLTDEKVDLVFSDQRRALSERFVNYYLTETVFRVVLAKRLLPSGTTTVDLAQLAGLLCILVAQEGQRQAEEDYHRDVLGVQSRFLMAGSLEDAKILVAAKKGFMLVDDHAGRLIDSGVGFALPVTSQGRPLVREYYAFWRQRNSGYCVEAFARLLKEQFDSTTSEQ